MGYEMDGRGLIPGKYKKFYTFQTVHTGLGVRPASYSMGKKAFLPRGKTAGS
jgi:hypothetical protein